MLLGCGGLANCLHCLGERHTLLQVWLHSGSEYGGLAFVPLAMCFGVYCMSPVLVCWYAVWPGL